MDIDELKLLAEENKLICIDKFETHQSAIIGITDDTQHLIYSYDKLVESFMNKDNISREEAEDWVSYNVVRSIPYFKPNEPILIHTLD